MMNDMLLFVLCFLGINFLIFIPTWIIGVFSKIQNSKKPYFDDKFYYILKKSFYLRYTDDFFRLVFEIQIVVLALLLVNHINSYFFKYLLLILVIIAFIYATYVAIITRIFKKTPNLINDIEFAKTGLVVYKKNVPFALFACIILLIGVFFVSSNLIDNLIESSSNIQNKRPVIITLVISVLLSSISIKKVDYTSYHSSVSFSLLKHFILNIKKCVDLNRSLKSLNMSQPYKYAQKIDLKEKPNIILIFLESYGSFTFTNEEHGNKLKKKFEDLNRSLRESNWSSMSCLSESPVASGGSWLSHTSVLFGAKVKDIAAHELIFGATNFPEELESLPKFLSFQGYKTKLGSSVSHDTNEVNWSKLKNSYPFDDIMLIDRFNYTGKKVSTYGYRYTLPDEYTFNYAFNSIQNESPYFLCMSTTNSHYNFISPLETLENWEDYNTKDFELTDGLKKNNLKNYFTAINYQFEYVHNFLVNENPDNTIVVLIGDHQPPLIIPVHADKATPVHVISKNKDFLSAFKEFNFTEGLIPEANINAKHESFFSKFLYALNKVYGSDKNIETPIFEEGINLY